MRRLPYLWLITLAACASAYGPGGGDDDQNDPAPAGSDASTTTMPPPDAGTSGGGGGGGADASTGGGGPTSFTIAITLSGTGRGTISSSPSGIVCSGLSCSGSFTSGTTVTLTPVADPGSVLRAWSGACTGAGTCAPTVSSNVSLTAEFFNFQGTWTGQYSNTRNAYGCTFNNRGTLTMNVTASGATTFTSSASINGLELRYVPSCNYCCSTSSNTNSNGTITATGNFTGSHDFYISEASSTLSFPYTATISGNTMTGSWTCAGCTGSFALTKQ